LRRVHLEIGLATPSKMSMIFRFVWSIALDTSQALSSASKSSMSLLSAIFTLGDSRVHICAKNSGNIVFYIKISVNQTFSIATTLDISYVQPYNCYI